MTDHNEISASLFVNAKKWVEAQKAREEAQPLLIVRPVDTIFKDEADLAMAMALQEENIAKSVIARKKFDDAVEMQTLSYDFISRLLPPGLRFSYGGYCFEISRIGSTSGKLIIRDMETIREQQKRSEEEESWED